jgi:hypothetical protein
LDTYELSKPFDFTPSAVFKVFFLLTWQVFEVVFADVPPRWSSRAADEEDPPHST